MGKNGNSDRLFSRAPKSLWMVKFHCSHEIKRSLRFGRKAMIHLHSTLKSRDITLLTNFHMVKAMVFPVVMYGCESWTIKECWRIYAFKLWCWKRRLRVFGHQGDQTSQFQKKSTLNIHWKDWSWSWSSSTLATWCKELNHWKRPWFWERLRTGEEVRNRGWDGWMASLTQWTWVWENSER